MINFNTINEDGTTSNSIAARQQQKRKPDELPELELAHLAYNNRLKDPRFNQDIGLL